MKVSKFVKQHIPLVACTLGLAVVGYMGYCAIRRIISKCQKTKKIDDIRNKSIQPPKSNTSKTKSLLSSGKITPLKGVNKSDKLVSKKKHEIPSLPLNKVTDLKITSGKVTVGQGEYIVFHQTPTGEKRALSPETFEKVYQILLQHSPHALVNNGSNTANADCANRYELLSAKLKELDPSLVAMFVPRTLYELVFIRKCINEDIRNNKICPNVSPSRRMIKQEDIGDQQKYESMMSRFKAEEKARRCWHLCYFEDMGNDNDPGVKNVVYRMNKAVFKILNSSPDNKTHKEFAVLAENEIQFLKSYYKNFQESVRTDPDNQKKERLASCNSPGPTTNFATESTRGDIKPMGIRSEADAQIIRNSLILDCSEIAKDCLFLYRGTDDFQDDSVSFWKNEKKPYSLSYARGSLFAGAIFDGGATSYHYMRSAKNAYAIPLPFDQVANSPFYVPTTHTASQLFGNGEAFHARTKCWKGFDVLHIHGINMGANAYERAHLESDLEESELKNAFQTYKSKAIQLK